MPQVHLDTIPIWDAYKQETECPLCAMEAACERQFLDVALGGAMMEPDTRVATNEKGFCAEHFRKLYAMENKLSLALMTHTHLKDVIASAHKAAEPLRKAVDAERKKNPVARAAGGVTKSTPVHKQLEQLAAHVDGRMDSCFICERIETTMARYVETICYLYKKDESFPQGLRRVQGRVHAALSLAAARRGAAPSPARCSWTSSRRCWTCRKGTWRAWSTTWSGSRSSSTTATRTSPGARAATRSSAPSTSCRAASSPPPTTTNPKRHKQNARRSFPRSAARVSFFAFLVLFLFGLFLLWHHVVHGRIAHGAKVGPLVRLHFVAAAGANPDHAFPLLSDSLCALSVYTSAPHDATLTPP